MKISFIPPSKEFENFVDSPSPSKNMVPKWYKDSPVFSEKDISFTNHNMITNFALKQCMPFLDSMTMGYIQTTWTDIFVEIKDGFPVFRQKNGPYIVGQRENTSLPLSDSYYPIEFIWKSSWIPKTPNGYSSIVSSPLNRFDLPFITGTGIVDTDDYNHMNGGQFPFYLQKGFSGLIPKGTPMYQIIPFKRETWEKEDEKFDELEMEKKIRIMSSMYYGVYKKLFWKKKKFS